MSEKYSYIEATFPVSKLSQYLLPLDPEEIEKSWGKLMRFNACEKDKPLTFQLRDMDWIEASRFTRSSKSINYMSEIVPGYVLWGFITLCHSEYVRDQSQFVSIGLQQKKTVRSFSLKFSGGLSIRQEVPFDLIPEKDDSEPVRGEGTKTPIDPSKFQVAGVSASQDNSRSGDEQGRDGGLSLGFVADDGGPIRSELEAEEADQEGGSSDLCGAGEVRQVFRWA